MSVNEKINMNNELVLPGTEIKKIAVFRALQLGDMLCAVPALRALRSAYPDSEITLLGLPWAKSLMERFGDYIDRFLWFPGFPGLPEQPFSAPVFSTFLQKVISEEFDLVFQMQGNGSIVNPMVELFGAKHTAGYVLPGSYAPDNGLYMTYPDYGHEAARHVRLMEFLGIPSKGTDLEFPLFEKDYADFNEAALPLDEGAYICIHAGSRGAGRRWPPEYFAKLADLAASRGFVPVLTGTADELEIVQQVASHMRSSPLIAAGKTTLGAVGVLLLQSSGLISNCTGVSHISAALKVPSVIVSMDGEPGRWGPQNHDLHAVIDWTTQPDFRLVEEALERMLDNS